MCVLRHAAESTWSDPSGPRNPQKKMHGWNSLPFKIKVSLLPMEADNVMCICAQRSLTSFITTLSSCEFEEGSYESQSTIPAVDGGEHGGR